MTLKPWREVAIPHEDVLKGTFQQAEFAADLSRVHQGTATKEYQDPVLFFQRTFITEGMRLLLDSVVRRLAGKDGDPVIQLQTAFGGGKTHTMLAVYHLASGKAPASDLAGVSPILDAAGVTELPRARLVVLDGNKASPNQPQVHGDVKVNTLWGDLAWQLGGADAYALVADADASGTSPGKAVLETLLARHAPCVILIDELVAYIRQFEDGAKLTGGTFDSNLSFVQALTEALKAVPRAVLLASLPESDKELGSQRGVKALESLAHYFARVQALWKPVATEEAFEIVRRRLFTQINDRLAAEEVCRTFTDYYATQKEDLPQEVLESRYRERMLHAYPIHPEVFDRLYKDWSSLDSFQRTRGVLKLMAKVIHALWRSENKDPLILPGSLPLADASTRNDLIYYLPQGWDPVLERDVDGDRAETTLIDTQDSRLGSVQACRRTARSIFLGSAPSTSNQVVRGIELERVMLGVAQPGQQLGVYKDALRRLGDKLHYLNSGNNRFWFDTRPNLRREMEDRCRRFNDREDVMPVIRERVQKSLASGLFKHHVFTDHRDVPDDWDMRLVVLPPEAAFSNTGANKAIEHAELALKNRGDTPRLKQNRLIFLAAEFNQVQRMRDQVRSTLAWQSIVNDAREGRFNLDMFQMKQAQQSLEQGQETLRRTVREAYKWLLAPVQHAVKGKGLGKLEWETFALNPSASNLTQEIERLLKENELLITEWAPIHLATMLRGWFWREDVSEMSALDVWQKTCQYLYLPRLRDSTTFQTTLAAGVESKDFFGLAQGKEDGRFQGFVFGKRTTVFLDASTLIVEKAAAEAYAERVRLEEEARATPPPPPAVPGGSTGAGPVGLPETPPPLPPVPPAPTKALPKRFFASIDLDPYKAKTQFADLVDEVVLQFSATPGVKVRVSIEIEAESPAGFDDGLQRIVKENCSVLGIKRPEFESE